jgi:bifunctional enzyme CysN/CysC
MQSPVSLNVDLRKSGGLVWITGLSASGKTTVGRKVKAGLDERGYSTIFLDGDDLRSILGGKWGYDRDSRVELARIYFRLCNHLSSQGYTVVICAVAMYREIEEWIDSNITNAMKVLLRVPESERMRRDANTKNVYESIKKAPAQYEEPSSPHVIFDNYGSTTPEDVASKIVEMYASLRSNDAADKGRTAHWATYYSNKGVTAGIQKPSPFAEFVNDRLKKNSALLELGCGNGRDARYFAQSHNVIAIDRSNAAIELAQKSGGSSIKYIAGSLPELAGEYFDAMDVIYTRFVLHAMPLEEEINSLTAAYSVLRSGGQLWIECRSINDRMAMRGEVISPTERIFGHYRRFIVLDELAGRLNSIGFRVEEAIESDNLAVFGDDNPVVIRIKAVKP